MCTLEFGNVSRNQNGNYVVYRFDPVADIKSKRHKQNSHRTPNKRTKVRDDEEGERERKRRDGGFQRKIFHHNFQCKNQHTHT